VQPIYDQGTAMTISEHQDIAIVNGPSKPLVGSCRIAGSKNTAMPVLAAASLCQQPFIVRNVPQIGDVERLCEILCGIGVAVTRAGSDCRFEPSHIRGSRLPAAASRLRGSIYALAPMAVFLGRGEAAQIGGDPLAGRSLEPHARALAGFGLTVTLRNGGVEFSGGPPKAAEFDLYDRAGGISASALALMLAAAVQGRSCVRRISLEPEVLDCAAFLRCLGAKIDLEGDTAMVEGPLTPKATEWSIPEDRVFWGTIAAATAITGGNITLPVQNAARFGAIVAVLEACGVETICLSDAIRVSGKPQRPLFVETGPFPAFPSDLVPPVMALMTQAPGQSRVVESIYPDRFSHVDELKRMGASIAVDGSVAVVNGVASLIGRAVRGKGIREAAALVLAGLAAEGKTMVSPCNVLSRGYEDLLGTLCALGASAFVA